MKKILSLILVIATVFSTAALLVSCSDNGDAPDGMQLVRGGEDVGYYMYGPEEWVVSNAEEFGIACTYVSKLNNTSVTLTQANLPDVSMLASYIADSFPEDMAFTVLTEVTDAKLGNADKAYKTVYTYEYGEYTAKDGKKYPYVMQVMQIFAFYKDRSYILTYSASTATYDGEVTYYEEFLEKATSVIDNIKFVDITANSEPIEYNYGTKNGYTLVSDKSIAGFNLYIPESYSVDFSTSMVSVSREDGTNISVAEATGTNTYSFDYWYTRLETIDRIASNVTIEVPPSDDDGETTYIENPTAEEIKGAQVEVDLGKNIQATSLKYSFTLAGKDYRVYQIQIVSGFFLFPSGYVFTYTAEADKFDANYAEMETILNNIEF